MNSEKFLHRVKCIVALNTEMLIVDNPNQYSASDIIKKIGEDKGLPHLSNHVLHCMRNGEKFPGVDKLFILGSILNVKPTRFLESGHSEQVDEFLSFDTTERRRIAKILANERDNS